MVKSVIALIATSALAAKLIHHLGSKQQLRRARHENAQHRDEVGRWEAEGGNPAPAPAKPRRQRRQGTASEG